MPTSPYTEAQVRKALAKVERVADFCRRHSEFDISERTIYRQRSDAPPPMREYVKDSLVKALVLDGLLQPAPIRVAPARGKKLKPKSDHPGALEAA